MTVYISTSIDKNICTILIYKDIDFFCQTEYSTFKKCSWYDFCIMRINYYKDIEKICTASLCEYVSTYIIFEMTENLGMGESLMAVKKDYKISRVVMVITRKILNLLRVAGGHE